MAEHEKFFANKHNYAGIFVFISRENFMRSSVEHDKRFITPGQNSYDSDQSVYIYLWHCCPFRINGYCGQKSSYQTVYRYLICICNDRRCTENNKYFILHYENTPIQNYWKFHHQKLNVFRKKFWYFSYFYSKHRLWVLVRTASPRRL